MGKFILVIVLVTLAVYLVVRLVETRGALFRRGNGGSTAKPERRPSGPLGPDDDPEFLRDLNRRRPHKDKPTDG
ncbi:MULTISPECIES: hypothetical protein [unclassified Nocardioides]|uniref:hypothetical protein n=1 Tax=unclassified Nocardioides TaxID=2615069 RepID=UPI0006FDA303|nr:MULTISPECIES: hypothetical protein [unclassified Nocardioides]KQY50171.1 hypothetical protein ASD30_21845 [Nocardioides sp. Root140]KQZ75795.1 hypothetical protein ASD66_05570 [Nocardioides sp. Root151]KRF14867.1 hypothetical protein ASH02_11355 [Nocardioides sp. Soil796]